MDPIWLKVLVVVGIFPFVFVLVFGGDIYHSIKKRLTEEVVQSVHIDLGRRDIGTTAMVSFKRFRSTRHAKFVCHQADPMMGGKWIEESNGIAAGGDLASKLNNAAQAAVSLAANTATSALKSKLDELSSNLQIAR